MSVAILPKKDKTKRFSPRKKGYRKGCFGNQNSKGGYMLKNEYPNPSGLKGGNTTGISFLGNTGMAYKKK